MNIFDLLLYGIEAQMSNEEKFMDDAIVFRFRKGDLYYKRVIQRQEIMGVQGGAISSSLLEDHICREVITYFKGIKKPEEGASLLNPHGQYATKFAENHGISINEALEHPTVKAHEVYFNSVIGEQVLKGIYPKQNTLKSGG